MGNLMNSNKITKPRDHLDINTEPVSKLRWAYQQWNSTAGESENCWLDMMAENVVMRSPSGGAPGMEFTKTRVGKSEAKHYFADLAKEWELVHVTPEEFIAQGDRVVVLTSVAFRFKRTGKVAHSPKADVFRFQDGQIVEFIEFFDTAAALAATCPENTPGEFASVGA